MGVEKEEDRLGVGLPLSASLSWDTPAPFASTVDVDAIKVSYLNKHNACAWILVTFYTVTYYIKWLNISINKSLHIFNEISNSSNKY